jgi:hypothetical protein
LYALLFPPAALFEEFMVVRLVVPEVLEKAEDVVVEEVED